MAKRVIGVFLLFLAIAAAILGLTDVGTHVFEKLGFESNLETGSYFSGCIDLEKTCREESSGNFLLNFVFGKEKPKTEHGYVVSATCYIYRRFYDVPSPSPGLLGRATLMLYRAKYWFIQLFADWTWEKVPSASERFCTNLRALCGRCWNAAYTWLIEALTYLFVYKGLYYVSVLGNVVRYVINIYLTIFGYSLWAFYLVSDTLGGYLLDAIIYVLLSFHYTEWAAIVTVVSFAYLAYQFLTNRFKFVYRRLDRLLKEPGVKQQAMMTVIAAKYVAVKLLHSNSDMHAFHMTSKINNKDVYMKVVRRGARKIAKQRLANEYQRTKQAYHPNIVRFIDWFQLGQACSLGLEYARFGNLKETMMERFSDMQSYHKFGVFRQIVSAIQFFHTTGYAHLNIRPGSVLVFNPWAIVKLTGFDRAVKIGNKRICHVFDLHPISIPGEAVRRKAYDPVKADIWALGSLFFYILTGDYVQKDFHVCFQKAVFPHIPQCDEDEKRGVINILNSLLNTDPNKRPEAYQLRAKFKYFGQ